MGGCLLFGVIMNKSDLICVGAIAGSFGVRGDVRIKSFCVEAQAIASYGQLYNEDGSCTFSINLIGSIAGGLSARLTGIASKEEADSLRGLALFAKRDRLPNLPDDEFYHADLISLRVQDTGGLVLGQVNAVHNHGAGDLVEITGSGLKDSLLVSFTKAAVPLVDLKAGVMIVDLPQEPDDHDG
ncbi:MAG: 16S rRNA processing protein RimM [Paracoccaceae bacterium]